MNSTTEIRRNGRGLWIFQAGTEIVRIDGKPTNQTLTVADHLRPLAEQVSAVTGVRVQRPEDPESPTYLKMPNLLDTGWAVPYIRTQQVASVLEAISEFLAEPVQWNRQAEAEREEAEYQQAKAARVAEAEAAALADELAEVERNTAAMMKAIAEGPTHGYASWTEAESCGNASTYEASGSVPDPRTKFPRVREAHGRLEFRGPYNADFVVQVKRITGREWMPASKAWTVPVEAEADLLTAIRATYRLRVEVRRAS